MPAPSPAHQSSSPYRFHLRPLAAFMLVALFLLAVAMACSLPSFGRKTATPISAATATPAATPKSLATLPPQPTPTARDFPPQLVDSDPLPGSEIALQNPITLYFNQPMDQTSVEASLSGLSGQYNWLDASTLAITPAEKLPPQSEVSLQLAAGAQAANGLQLSQPVSLTYRTAGFLRLAQRLPDPGAAQVNPTSAVVAAFNRPVVPLGADPAGLPVAFSLQPEASGRSEWLNTSTFAFYPDPALAGGITYTVQINPDLSGVEGSPLEGAESWSFSTEKPRLLTVQPPPQERGVRLDANFILTFNQPMDSQSVTASFSISDPQGQPVPGEMTWDETATVFTFDPTSQLRRDTTYSVILGDQARSGGGTPLENPLQVTVRTVPALKVIGTEPHSGQATLVYSGVTLNFNAPIYSKDILQFVTFSPEVAGLRAFSENEDRTLHVYGDFAPGADYTLTLSPNFPDAWNGRLGQEYTFDFSTLPLDPDLVVIAGSDVLFLTPQDTSLTVQATNLSQLSLAQGSVPLEDFESMLAPGGYQLRQAYQPADQVVYQQELSLEPNRSQPVAVSLSPEGQPLSPGLYFLRFQSQALQYPPGPYLLVASNVHLTFKLSATDALVWAVDLRTNAPVAGAPVAILAQDGSPLASGQTDAEGVFSSKLERPLQDVYALGYAMLGQPGEELFSLALSNWSTGVDGWNFGILTDYSPPYLKAYLYTDRPIYRPGQTLYFRAIARQAYNGRYDLPDLASLPLSLTDSLGNQVATFNQPLSAFGTASGSFTLPGDAEPGNYSLTLVAGQNDRGSVAFQVADYRKPEINLQVSFGISETLAGGNLPATVSARYFFDAPAGGLDVQWKLFRRPAFFQIPGYQVGKQDESWLSPFTLGLLPEAGVMITEGQGSTGPDGLLKIEVPIEPADARWTYTLEATTQDESGLPVSGRAEVQVNPAEYYIGVRPDAWLVQAGQELGFDVLVTGWDQKPAGARPLRAEFQKVVWERVEPQTSDLYGMPTFIPHHTPVGSTDFTTGPDGVARLAFTPPEPGTYQLDVYGVTPGASAAPASGALTQALVWVGGPGQAVWPNLPNQRLRLTTDKDLYNPGENAQLFIPNLLGERVPALVTVERGVVLRHQMVMVEGAGLDLALPLGADDAPNVYVAVTLLKGAADGKPDFRQGYLELAVAPLTQTLRVELLGEPQRAGPGSQVTLTLRVSDQDGNPVQGEFSISMVDLAVLALADPNAPDILPAFYGPQPLGVRSGLSLVAYTGRKMYFAGGGGGGGEGGGAPLVLRENFPDTAFWNAEIVTDANGEAQVQVSLPDNLTTWQVEARGLTVDTRVGQAKAQVVATKDLLVRPVTPRFLVSGDHALLAAVINNNTSADLPVMASLQASGFNLDDPSASQQQVQVPAGGRARVEWWGVVQDVASLDLVFSAQSGDLSDATRPTLGALPVLSFTAPQTFGTSGLLGEGGEIQEQINIPRWAGDPPAGQLQVELSPSLAAAMLNALKAVETNPCDCTEGSISSFLPNLEIYRALQEFGLDAPGLKEQVESSLQESLARLVATQNEDGGWGWWEGGESEPFISAYALFGLNRARQAGADLSEDVLQRAVGYLQATLPAPEMLTKSWQLDRLAFTHFVLVQSGSGDAKQLAALYADRERLDPWGKALLALSLAGLSPDDERARTILSELASSALRSATGAHWEDGESGWQNMSTPVSATAMVLMALAERDPASPLVADALRYLVDQRGASGGWSSSYETAWTLMAMERVLKATGELGGDFQFSADLNGSPLANGQAGDEAQLNSAEAQVPAASLDSQGPNTLTIQRGDGPGRLYYSAALSLERPAEDAPALNRGLTISRAYYPLASAITETTPLSSARAGDLITARLILVLPESAYYLMVQDYIPAGAEVLDINLKTSQQSLPGCQTGNAPCYDPRQPFAEGWGWWYFNGPRISDDHVTWSAESLPPGTYELTYTLVLQQPGEYRVLPARAWQLYFPEVQGNSAGEVFKIAYNTSEEGGPP